MIKQIYEKIDRKMISNMLFITYLLMPLFEFDHLLYKLFDSVGIPLPSTIFHYLWFALLIVLCFLKFEEKKKRVFIIALGFGVICLAYFVAHHFVVKDMFDLLYLPGRYVYSVFSEFSYFVTVMLPLVFVYAVYKVNPSMKKLNLIVIATVSIISIPIVISNILKVGPSTYVGNVQDNIFSWFTYGYDDFTPRELANKFYFVEGNTLSMILFAFFPLLINVYLQEKKKFYLLGLIVIQALSMFMLGTRVSTYGVLIGIVLVLGVSLVMIILKKNKFNFIKLGTLALLLCFSYLILPYTPAVVNQGLAIESQWEFGQADTSIKDGIASGALNLTPGTPEYQYYYEYIFLDNRLYYYITFPDIYFSTLYSYEFDAKFWVDLVLDIDFQDRADGRDFEKIFFNYKWANLNGQQKLFGFSYSTFMNGGITLEQDFVVQKYQYGYLGFIVMCGPWFVILAIILVGGIKNFYKNLNLDTLTLGAVVCALFLISYMTGHLMDEFFGVYTLALLVGMLINRVWLINDMGDDGE